MGTDATAFIEYWAGPESLSVWGEVDDPGVVVTNSNIESPVSGRVWIGRNYAMFGALAGVRSQLYPLIAPRGLPSIVGGTVFHAAFRHICADDVPAEFKGEDEITHSEAIRRVESGLAQYGGPFRRGNYDFVTEGVHRASWLYVRELEAALAHHGMTADEQNILFASVLASMRLLDARLGQDRCRLVFWFDTL